MSGHERSTEPQSNDGHAPYTNDTTEPEPRAPSGQLSTETMNVLMAEEGTTATMPPFILNNVKRWTTYLQLENRVDIPGFNRPQPMTTERELSALHGMLTIMELVTTCHRVTKMFDVFDVIRVIVSELMQDTGVGVRQCRLSEEMVTDVDNMALEMPRFLFKIQEVTNISTWISLNAPVAETGRSPSPVNDDDEVIWSDEDGM